ncbi:gliding motility-associated C-terminal domain-containing protein [Cytophagales bacterium LB-30]|uniref:Gliding motility-associated C-terminal domain-containing protein n=1 Tax=Shiella aurantiaca TaxID=3058365 RepID=A0ABT8F0K9_9BACT|nr:gliding motility-associated C-terminal domain-containing protein [Shiella aurantiaca]MDN4163980.1 gliding motility-associated C-terminal domain-containing protein [Shiella aurantiaca]
MNRFFAFTLGAFLFFSLNAFAQSEICNNNLDDDGDGLIDCNDTDCQFGANIEEGCNCFDNVDNDGDGTIDENDPDCTKYFGLEFIGEGSDCSLDPPAGSDVFDSISDDPTFSGQNTVDTQSKMAVGDVDGDGQPDIVTTSKFNKAVRVINTLTGDEKSLFRTPQDSPNGYFPDNNNKHYQELEVAIADIDGDEVAEIYTIASFRSTSNDPATKFYLLGFRYAPGTLIPIFSSPVYLGTQRPGSMGITDFDGDGLAEVYVRNMIFAAENGAILANPGGNWQTEVNSGSVAVNIDKSSANQELVCGKIIYTVPNLSARTTQTLTVWKNLDDTHPNYYFPKVVAGVAEYGTVNFSTTSVADINEDGNIDVVLSGARTNNTGPTTVFYWDVAQNIATHFSPPDTTAAAGGGGSNGWPWGTSRVNIGEIDGDGRLELTFTAGTRLWALDVANDGTLTTAWPFPYYRALKDAKSGLIANTVYDFNNDGAPELVYRDSEQLVIVNGADGGVSGTGTQTELKVLPCQSHTFTEGPIIADVNGDGATDICVPCYTSNNANAFKLDADIQQQALGGIRLYYSSANDWLPTRQVWNQAGYFVIHIKDDLTVPRTQMDMTTVFGTGACPNGVPGPQQPFNTYLNQVPTLGPNGCPVFPAPDITFAGDDPNDPSVDPTSPDYFPAVKFTPPTCGDLGISVEFNIVNNGSLTISDDIPVTFYLNNPTDAAANASYILHSLTLPVTNFEVGDTLSFGPYSFNGPGTTFTLYASLNDDGSALPLDTTRTSTECKLGNNIYSVLIDPQPFDVAIEIVSDNNKCTDDAPDQGELKAVITKDGVVVTDYSKYAFQWYVGEAPDTTRIPAPEGTGDRLFFVSDTTRYTLIVTNTEKGCSSNPIDTLVSRAQPEIFVNFNEISRQTQCFPYNGELEVFLTDVNGAAVDPTGYTFAWYVTNFSNPLGIVGRVGDNLVAAEYLVTAEKNGCTYQGSYTLLGPTLPTVSASLLQGVFSCTTPSSGSVTAVAEINGVVQDPANYEFEWYFWDEVNQQIGSLISATDKAATRTGLAAGWYAVVAKDIATQCSSTPPIPIEVTDERIYPIAIITEVAPQTSCDENQPNGILEANVYDPSDLTTPLDQALFNFEWFQGDNTLAANAHTSVDENGRVALEVAGGGIPYTVRVSYKASGCSHDTIFVISEDKNFPVVTGTTQPNSVCNDALASQQYTGAIDLDITFDGVAVNDLAGYTVDWFHGTDTNIADSLIVSNSSFTLSGLKDGYYSVLVTKDDVHCTSTPVDFQILNETVQPIVNLALTPETTCSGTPNGAISASVDETAQGGAAAVTTGYTFAWFSGNDTLAANALGVTSATLSGIEGGANYTVLVTNTLTGCQRVQSTFLADESELPVISLDQTPNTVCDVSLTSDPSTIQYTGTVTATLSPFANGSSDYTVELYEGAAVAGTPSTQNVAITTAIFTNLEDGFYTVRWVDNDLGCTSLPQTIEVKLEPDLPVIVLTPTGSTNCPGGTPNGSISTDIDAGAPSTDYAYQWYTGSDDSSPIAGATGATITGIQGGATNTYTVRVTNLATGCRQLGTITLPDDSEEPTLTLAQTPNTICDATLGFDGAISITLDATFTGSGDYSAKLFDDGGVEIDNETTITGNTFSFTGLEDGDYTVTWTDDVLGCTSQPFAISVQPNKTLPTVVLTPTGSTNCDPALPNGSLTVSVNGSATDQSADFTYEWFEGDSDSDPLIGGATAFELLNRQGGAAEQYTVRVTDISTGCFALATTTLPDDSEEPTLTLAQTPNTICDATLGFDGEIAITLDATFTGSGDYSAKLFDDGGVEIDSESTITATTFSFTGLEDGDYTVTWTDDVLGCTSQPFAITVQHNKTLPTVVLTPTGSTNCDPALPNGSLTVSVNGSATDQSADFTYEWFEGDSDSDPLIGGASDFELLNQQGAAGKQYTVRVTDLSTGCFALATTTLSDNSTGPVINLSQTPNTICDDSFAPFDGEIDVSLAAYPNGSGDYTVDLYAGNDATGTLQESVDIASTTHTFTDLEDGFYTVVWTDNVLGCISQELTIEVEEDVVLPVITSVVKPQESCDPSTPNGSLTFTVGGTDTGYRFNLYEGTTTTDPLVGGPQDDDGIFAGLEGNTTYLVEVIDLSTGCRNEQTVIVPEVIKTPELSVSKTDIISCDPADSGEITATIEINGVAIGAGEYADYDFEWYFGQDDSGTPLTDTDEVLGGIQTEGYYTVRAVHSVNNCESLLATTYINAPSPFNVKFQVITPPNFCSDFSGVVTAYVDLDNDNSIDANEVDLSNFTFEWYSGWPTNTPPANFFTDPAVQLPAGGPMTNYNNGVNFTGVANTFPSENDLATDTNGPTLFGVADGQYTLVATDANGCKSFATYYLEYLNAHDVTFTVKNDESCTNDDGEISVTNVINIGGTPETDFIVYIFDYATPDFSDLTALAGTALASVEITTSLAADLPLTVSGLAPGNYYVTAFNEAINCPSPLRLVTVEEAALKPLISISDIQPNQSCTTPGTGSFTVTVNKDPNDLVAIADYDVVVTAANDAAFNYTDNDLADGASTVVDGVGLEDDIYTVTVTSNSGCVSTVDVEIKAQPAVPVLSLTGIDIVPDTNCDPNNGSITVDIADFSMSNPSIPVGVITDYSFTWYFGPTATGTPIYTATGAAGGNVLDPSKVAPALFPGAGTYWLVATRTNNGAGNEGVGCSSSPLRIDIPDEAIDPTLDISTTGNTACNAPFTGEIVAEADGAAGTYDYELFLGAASQGTQSAALGTSVTFSPLGPNIYTLVATNQTTGCSVSRDIEIADTPIYPDNITFNANMSPQTFCSNNGSLDIDFTGAFVGTEGDYDITWFNSEADYQSNTPRAETTFNLSGLAAGVYVFTLQKNNGAGNGCPSSPYRIEVTEDITYPTLDLVANSNTTCSGTPDGSIEVNVVTTGLVSTFDISISPDPNGVGIQAGVNAFTFIELAEGTYTITAVDNVSGCSVSQAISITDKPIIPDNITFEDNMDPQTFCSDNGSLNIVLDAPFLNTDYNITWYNSEADYQSNTPRAETSFDLSGLAAGVYVFTLEKNNGAGNGCPSSPYRIEVTEDITYPTLDLVANSNTTCSGTPDGSIEVNVATAGLGSTFDISIAPDPNAVGVQAGVNAFTFANLAEGTYTIVAVDNVSGCSVSQAITVAHDPFIPENLDILINAIPQSNCTNPDGSITVSSDPANPVDLSEYTIVWYDSESDFAANTPNTESSFTLSNLSAGIYLFTLEKNTGIGTGCPSSPYRVEVKDNLFLPMITALPEANTSCDINQADGSIAISATTNNVVGTYTYTVTDAAGVVAGTQNGVSNFTITGLAEGVYTVSAFDELRECTNTIEVEIQAQPLKPADLALDIQVNNQLDCNPSGSIVVTYPDVATTDPSEYTIAWFGTLAEAEAFANAPDDPSNSASALRWGPADIAPNSTLDGVFAGTYYFVFQKISGEGAGCTSAIFNETIQELSSTPTMTFEVEPNTICEGSQPDGVVTVTPRERDGSTDTYSFAWSYSGEKPELFTDPGDVNEYVGATDGFYTVTVTNTITGCSSTSTVEVILDKSQSIPNIIEVEVTDPLDCNPTGIAEVTRLSIGGTIFLSKANGDDLDTDFDYLWFNGDPSDPATELVTDPITGLPVSSSVITGLGIGTYFVQVVSSVTECESIYKQIEVSDDDIIYPGGFIELTEPQISCDPTNGLAILTAFGYEGSDPSANTDTYSFTWYLQEGDSLVEIVPSGNTTITNTSNTSELANIYNGTYWVNILNTVTNCSNDLFFILEDQSDEFRPQVSVSSTPVDRCTPGDNGISDNGSLSANVVNALDGHTFAYTWYYHGDAPNENFNYATATPYANTAIVQNVAVGFYAVIVQDLITTCNNEPPVIVEVKDERNFPELKIREIQPMTNCEITSANGQLEASADGVVAGYTFEWYEIIINNNNQEEFIGPIIVNGQMARHLLIGQRAGSYLVRVTDNYSGCFSEQRGTITDETILPETPTALIEANRTNCVEPNGIITANVNGNNTDYFFDWHQGESVASGTFVFRGQTLRGADIGPYTVTATNMVTGCVSAEATVTIADERILPEFEFYTIPSHCENPTGYMEFTVLNNSVIETVEWTNVETGEVVGSGVFVNNVLPGIYEARMITFEGCEINGQVTVGTEITEYNGISANGDGINDFFQIDCISLFPNNNVKIFNRAGTLVFEIDNYNNLDRVFEGIGVKGVYPTGRVLPAGTYFYIIDKRDGSRPETGYLELAR